MHVFAHTEQIFSLSAFADDRITICPSDNSAIFTENYAAGTFFVYDFIGSGLSYISLETNTLPPLSSPPDMSWYGSEMCG